MFFRRSHALPQPGFTPTLIALATLTLCSGPVHAQAPGEPLALTTVQVVDTAPLPGLGTPLQDVPANVQVFGDKDLTAQQPMGVTDFLEANASSVNLNAAQGNASQPDVNFRGFTASPLLGLPQGLSVFMDGVRMNEPFGDVVNWDLLPHTAVANLQVMPGSHPAFGLNTLGGALSLNTKSGLTHPGGGVQAHAGSFGRQALEFEQGGRQENWNYYLAGNAMDEKGWAEHNPSQLRQFFGKVGHSSGDSQVSASLSLADNRLEGTQTLPLSMADNMRQAYTYPDINRNQSAFLNVKGSHSVSESLFLDANVYLRRYLNQNTSSNVNDDYDGTTDTVQAHNDRSSIEQNSWGMGVQLTRLGQLAGRRNQLQAGASADLGTARYTQDSQDASFTTARATVGSGAYTLNTDARLDNAYYGLYLHDTLNLDDRWTLSVAGRYNLATTRIADQTGSSPELNGEHTFTRFNPAAGINYNPSAHLTAYVGYNEGMRVPTPVELTCADPSAPCKLPNNFLSDPPLNMVVARTVEVGMRGKRGRHSTVHWSAAVYRTELNDDIQFISSQGTGTNTGYFKNVGATLRQGLEVAGIHDWGRTRLSVRYGYVEATYQSSFVVNSPANSSKDASDNITVQPGNQIPGIPRHTLKLRLSHDVSGQWNIGMNVLASGAVYARGDENNQDVNGQVPGYAIVNLDTRYRVDAALEFFVRINNLFDRQYANFGVLGENAFTTAGNTFDTNTANWRNEQFLGYGAPRGAWAGLRYRWN